MVDAFLWVKLWTVVIQLASRMAFLPSATASFALVTSSVGATPPSALLLSYKTMSYFVDKSARQNSPAVPPIPEVLWRSSLGLRAAPFLSPPLPDAVIRVMLEELVIQQRLHTSCFNVYSAFSSSMLD